MPRYRAKRKRSKRRRSRGRLKRKRSKRRSRRRSRSRRRQFDLPNVSQAFYLPEVARAVNSLSLGRSAAEVTKELVDITSEIKAGAPLDPIKRLEVYGRALMLAQGLASRGRRGRANEQQIVHVLMRNALKDHPEKDILIPNFDRFLNIFYTR